MLRVHEQRAIGVGVGVYEPRRDGQAGGVDDATGLGVRQVADCLYGVPGDADVGPVAGSAAPIDDGASHDDDIKHVGLLRRRVFDTCWQGRAQYITGAGPPTLRRKSTG